MSDEASQYREGATRFEQRAAAASSQYVREIWLIAAEGMREGAELLEALAAHAAAATRKNGESSQIDGD